MAALLDDVAVLIVIADGVHVAPENLRLLQRIAPGRVALVTDGIVASGLGDGTYRYGPLVAEVIDGRAVLPDGTLAAASPPSTSACDTRRHEGASRRHWPPPSRPRPR